MHLLPNGSLLLPGGEKGHEAGVKAEVFFRVTGFLSSLSGEKTAGDVVFTLTEPLIELGSISLPGYLSSVLPSCRCADGYDRSDFTPASRNQAHPKAFS